MANKGYFIITDISGYTEYLTGSELELRNYVQSEYERGYSNLEAFIKRDIVGGKMTVG